ncbi:hypothetical protein RYX36_017922, partial [Vicia faba]
MKYGSDESTTDPIQFTKPAFAVEPVEHRPTVVTPHTSDLILANHNTPPTDHTKPQPDSSSTGATTRDLRKTVLFVRSATYDITPFTSCFLIFVISRQMGFVDADEVPELCRLAQDYLRNMEGCKENIYQYLANGDNANALYAKLIEEFERCILSYFAFHWNRASFIITQRITKKLKVARVLSTFVEEIKAIKGDSKSCDDKVSIVQSERSSVLLLMGGGMGSGKST